MDTANNNQELESASVTLVDGLHFAGDIGGVCIDLDANGQDVVKALLQQAISSVSCWHCQQR